MTRALRVLALLTLSASPLAAQLAPPGAGGAVAYGQETRMLGHNLRVLMIGAHPDDEDTGLLAWLARGMGAEAAYLALNRGEGGQNLIGPELGETLGLLRSEELLSARQLDGARQYFTRAYDFGFSKTLDDTWAHWPRDSVLKDVVRIIRRFRPQVVVTIFTGTPRDGHGQHQAAGWAARAAFEAAGDPNRFPELEREEGLRPWTPLKLYQSTRFDTSATSLTLDGGRLDRATGFTYHQIAMASRSRHRSQDIGQLQRLGPSAIRVSLIADRTGAGAGGLFAGVDTTLNPLLGGAAARQYDSLVAVIRDGTIAARQHAADRAATILGAASDTTTPAWRDQARHLARARTMAHGLALDVRASDGDVVAGERVSVSLDVANGGDVATPVSAQVEAPGGWTVSGDGSASARAVASGALVTRDVTVTVPDTAAITTPYFLEQPRDGDMYRWPAWARQWWGEPFQPPLLRGAFALPGDPDPVTREASQRINDQATGELRRPVIVRPALDVRVDEDTVLLAAGAAHVLHLNVTVTHAAADTTRGRLQIEGPGGWTMPSARPFEFEGEDDRESFTFDVTIPATVRAGRYALDAVAVTADGRRFEEGQRSLDYEHVRPRRWVEPARVVIVVANLALPPLARVGYIRGAADRVPEALAGVGLPVELLDSSALARGDLSRFDAIVVGPRAYEVDSALIRYNRRLLAYVREGGLLLVQYQQYQFVRGQYAPLPLTIASPHDRVTDEHADVTVLDPASPVFTSPNRIGTDDWKDWIQERGLYFAHTWDPGYRPLLSMHDPGEAPLQGSLLVADVGKGRYIYTGLAFFRELPAGIPGAYRLFANLLGMRPAPVP
jgi:LmbE family N-acetylglucosaminyl deacetylase